MISGTLAGIIVAMSFTELFGQIFIKTYYETKKVYWFFMGWLFYALVLFLLYKAYSFTGMAISNGIWSSTSVVLTTLVGVFYYKEKLNMFEIAGLFLVVFGILLMGLNGSDVSPALE